VSQLGAGGMGEVYRARDTRLERTVAIKVLRPQLAGSPELRRRFEREARAISSLNHPNICTLHDIGHESGVDYLVMEYVEGETLAKRVAKGPLPPEEVLRHAIEIAGALEKAHRQGITHRDLKPGNIMLTKTGAKLLDFGLARLEVVHPLATAATISGPTEEPEAEHKLTAEGAIVGTFQYMAPEQLEGKQADARTDIFALGTVIYEMATGKPAFSGKSKASLIAAILDSEPPAISTLQPMAPPALERVVKTCLAKDPDERWQTAHDVKLQLEWIAEGGSQAGVPAPVVARRKSRERLAWLAAAVLAMAALVFAAGYVRRAPVAFPPLRGTVLPPENVAFPFAISISPDGTRLAYHTRSATGKTVVWVQSLERGTPQMLAGTEGALQPFWSPDGRSIGFFAGGELKRIEASGGPPVTICSGGGGDSGGAWGPDGDILFTPTSHDPIHRVPASGGTPTPVTRVDQSRQEIRHGWPCFLPDGRHFLYLAVGPGSGENDSIYVGSLDGQAPKLLLRGGCNPVYAPNWPPAHGLFSRDRGEHGYLLFLREQVLMAQPFDAARLELQGNAIPVAERIAFNMGNRRGAFSASPNGVLTYLSGRAFTAGGPLAWFDRSGKQIGSPFGANCRQPRLSPDQKKVAVYILDQAGNGDVWIHDITRGIATRFTVDPAIDSSPIWSPDGGRIVFVSQRKGVYDLYLKDSSGARGESPVLESPGDKAPTDWSPDGRFIAYTYTNPGGKNKQGVWILPLFGDRKPFAFADTEFTESEARFSPDGRWVAYVSDESRRDEVYVAPFSGASPAAGGTDVAAPGGKQQVSTGGGVHPVWRRDGKELYYLDPQDKLMAAEIRSKGASLEIGAPRTLFQCQLPGQDKLFEVAGNGERFLLRPPAQATNSPLTLVVNWAAGLRK
jgi:Tol biopolymer transport system component/predicted Ser/Thr protein kinase